MFVVELFIPLEKPDGTAVPVNVFERIKTELTERFGGVTAHLQSPAEGAWKPEAEDVIHDRIAIFEVMVEDVDTAWWRDYRHRLEVELDQHRILARLHQVTVL
ncbi:MAG: hypothetical protein JNL14_02240 [Devosia sp.]|uniref:hypothetical protein n=1 Tax=Devosia sp. TaxID=1871048 RepID=UPI001A3B3FD2|nr:hypothetical protein [Devosia sp.]MBL8596539.1 hypothetical protein [Devosia sp.]